MWRKIKITIVALLVTGMAALSFCPASAFVAGPLSVSVDGKTLSLALPPVMVSGHLLVPVADVGGALGADVVWESTNRTVAVSSRHHLEFFHAGGRGAGIDNVNVKLSVPTRISQGRLLVPVRFLAENLGAKVTWDGNTRTVQITSRQPAVAQRVYAPAFPARVAFASDGYLWLLDGTKPGAAPVRVTRSGSAHIMGWSPDGRWLLYLQSTSRREFMGREYLWVVGADGTRARQVDPDPVNDMYGVPAWSPSADIVAFSNVAGGDTWYGWSVKTARVTDQDVTVTTLVPEGRAAFDFAWAPDGRSLAVSFARTAVSSLRVDRLNLQGGRTGLFSLGGEGQPDATYSEAAVGLKFSPDGHYLAYFLRYNAGSASTDGVPIQVMDLQDTGRPLQLGIGLHYAQWLAWSPDSRQLAFIRGGGREATANKHLAVADVRTGVVTDCGRAGQAEVQPEWSGGNRAALVFCRGPEQDIYREVGAGGPLVPDQRIWRRDTDGNQVALTAGTEGTADCLPQVSPDGRYLDYVRLTDWEHGSLYLKSPAGGREVELVRGLDGYEGYYGDYLPAWVDTYWSAAP